MTRYSIVLFAILQNKIDIETFVLKTVITVSSPSLLLCSESRRKTLSILTQTVLYMTSHCKAHHSARRIMRIMVLFCFLKKKLGIFSLLYLSKQLKLAAFLLFKINLLFHLQKSLAFLSTEIPFAFSLVTHRFSSILIWIQWFF